ncbi:MAG: glycosyl transferase family 2 [Flavobacteriaceae bacterium]|nr:glycosyl transferase family 2 [Flavobacteriaceae bacterium]|tara:strand:+ start:32071 stop:33576 length:1506 start_codon:yes stop_codon:yes gene_type:complete
MNDVLHQILLIFISIIIFLYTFSLIIIFIYSLAQGNLLLIYLNAKSKANKLNWNTSNKNLPMVTIQLPIYNELYVIERLINSVKRINYPKEKLQIQVLDDSNDQSITLTSKLVKKVKNEGLDIIHIKRKNRKGFKAGALKEGLKSAKGEFIAIFDADFIPDANFLENTIPYFKNKKVGLVQTKWGHINNNYSILTKIQAFALDAHFSLEQVGRNAKGHFINFNGTAGVWRKSAIIDAGNWQADTLAEDLDLSYRAQLKNWKFVYLENVTTPAELPITINAIRSQQFRWNKGGAENFQKIISKILKSNNISFKTKVHGILHLFNSSVFLNIFLVGILSVPMLYIKSIWPDLAWYYNFISLFIISTIIYFISYWFVHKNLYGTGIKSFINYIQRFVIFYCLTIGFSLHNSIAVLEGHLRKKSDFIRTPKFNLKDSGKSFKNNKYVSGKISYNVIYEGLITFYFLFGLFSPFIIGNKGDFGLFPFHLMLFIGFAFLTIKSLKIY